MRLYEATFRDMQTGEERIKSYIVDTSGMTAADAPAEAFYRVMLEAEGDCAPGRELVALRLVSAA